MTPGSTRLNLTRDSARLSLAKDSGPWAGGILRIAVGEEVFVAPALAVRRVLDREANSTIGFLLESDQAEAEAIAKPGAPCRRLKKVTIAETPAGASGFGHGLPSEYIELRCMQSPQQPCPEGSTCALREISRHGYRVVALRKQTRPEVMKNDG